MISYRNGHPPGLGPGAGRMAGRRASERVTSHQTVARLLCPNTTAYMVSSAAGAPAGSAIGRALAWNDGPDGGENTC